MKPLPLRSVGTTNYSLNFMKEILECNKPNVKFRCEFHHIFNSGREISKLKINAMDSNSNNFCKKIILPSLVKAPLKMDNFQF